MGNLNALNRAFEKAFAHTATKETLMDLLSCLGEELCCDRIAVFEVNNDNTFDNTHEWCCEGTVREREFLQGVPVQVLDSWADRLFKDEILKIPVLEDIKDSDPDVYALFHSQDVHAVIVSKLAFHTRNLGFFVLENPAPQVIEDPEVILPGMRFILSSLVYSDHLVRRLEKIGYTDRMTGAGNRLSLQDHLEELNENEPVGALYCETIAWEDTHPNSSQVKEEQALLHTGQVLCNVFGEDQVFRVGEREFLVLTSGEDEASFESMVRRTRGLFAQNGLTVATGRLWTASVRDGFDSVIRQAHLLVYADRAAVQKKKEDGLSSGLFHQEQSRDMARIHLARGDAFFHQADSFLAEIFEEPVLTAVIDVNYFKLYNDIFGRRAGNLLLEEIAISIEEEAERFGGVAGYLGGDNFCLMIPVQDMDYERLKHFIGQLFAGMKYPDGFTPAMGIYISSDRQENMITMYDRALTALAEIKGSYMEHFRFYDAGHFQHLRDDKLLLMDIKKGLPEGEFFFYLQPQVHERSGKIVGAEALARWKRDGNIISPNRFIPLLEKTGYIFAMDSCIWEQAAAWIAGRKKRGLPMVSISLNVSRVDFYFTDIADHFIRLLEKYSLPPESISLEITESAFTDNTDSILEAVKKLHDAGIRVMMDDFGSGSSSLSMLHTMNVDVLKTDVRFMSSRAADSRAVSIVESVVTMAHMIGMLVVTEGVETKEQRDNLIALGDNYAQGFFFYRPMPVEQFEKLLENPENIGEPPRRGGQIMTNHLGFRNMIQEGMVSDTLLDNIIGPAAVYRDENGRLSLVQVNDQYTRLAGIGREQTERMEHFMEKYRCGEGSVFSSIFHGADTHPLEGAGGRVDLRREDGTVVPVEVRIFLLYSCERHKLYLATMQERQE